MASKNNPSARIKPKTDINGQLIDAAKSSEINRIVSLNDGQHAYLRDPITFQTVRYSTSNPAFVAALMQMAGKGMEGRIRTELTNLAKPVLYMPGWLNWEALLGTFNGLTEQVAA